MAKGKITQAFKGFIRIIKWNDLKNRKAVRMKVLYLLFILAWPLFFAGDARACTTTGAVGGHCRGCRLDNIKKDQSWMNFYSALKDRIGDKNIYSCFRTRGCQLRLLATCRTGQAAKYSNHEKGIAMDINSAYGKLAQDLARKHVKGHFKILENQCRHKGFHITNSYECGGANQQGRGEGYRGKGSMSPATQEYLAEKKGVERDNSGNYYYNGVPISCLAGQKGGWYRRKNGEWVKMTWNCPP